MVKHKVLKYFTWELAF